MKVQHTMQLNLFPADSQSNESANATYDRNKLQIRSAQRYCI